MNKKAKTGILIWLGMLNFAAVTGVPHLKQPDLVEPIALIVFFLIDKREEC
jgi:hypothetical protein